MRSRAYNVDYQLVSKVLRSRYFQSPKRRLRKGCADEPKDAPGIRGGWGGCEWMGQMLGRRDIIGQVTNLRRVGCLRQHGNWSACMEVVGSGPIGCCLDLLAFFRPLSHPPTSFRGRDDVRSTNRDLKRHCCCCFKPARKPSHSHYVPTSKTPSSPVTCALLPFALPTSHLCLPSHLRRLLRPHRSRVGNNATSDLEGGV